MSGDLENEYQLFIKGISNQTKVLRIHKDASIEDLLKLISKWNGIPVPEQRVLYAGKQLEDKKDGKKQYLSDYRIEDQSNLFVVLRLKGGQDNGVTTSPVSGEKELDESVELSDLPDMITWDDDPDNKRAKMPCGHAIGPESLTAFCRSLLTAGKFMFRCPYISPDRIYCGALWEYYVVRRLAVLGADEKKEFETKITQNYLRKASGIQECSKCGSFCERANKTDRRVVCPYCTRSGSLYEFCWYCLGEWKTSGTDNCGNTACTGEDPRLKIIRDAPKKKIVGLDGCPGIRACPSCGLLIEHERDCKHMVCPCGKKFCFICLKMTGTNGQYRCGSYNSHCTITAVQTTIPGQD